MASQGLPAMMGGGGRVPLRNCFKKPTKLCSLFPEKTRSPSAISPS
ncbi:MAG TPA: hypothetical protein VFZ09_43315 [Archangium sp.]|nr:hypothetical protein [Archangium sp.]HEX5753109.1 hypothetical protein [Archangium sp.]